MSDVDDEWDVSGFDDLVGDRFMADVSTVDAQDTLDVSAQFFRVCARVYMDNPLHNPVYEWLSRLPRTGNGNIKAISDHLVLALRLYVDTLNSGATLRLGPTDGDGRPGDARLSVEGYSSSSTATAQGAGGPSSAAGHSQAASPSQRYQQSRRFREILQAADAPSASRSPSTSEHPRSSVDSAALSQRPPSSTQGTPSPSSVPSLQNPPPASPKEAPPTPEDGLSYVARLAREGEGW
ncbi:MAG: hypothetical protein ACYCS8_13370 [Acidithiobacillus sp.]